MKRVDIMKNVSYEKYYILYDLQRNGYYVCDNDEESVTNSASTATHFSLEEAEDIIKVTNADRYIIVEYDAMVTKEYSIKNHSFEDYTKAMNYCKKRYGDNWLKFFKLIPCFNKYNRVREVGK